VSGTENDITRLLGDLRAGKPEAESVLIDAVYGRLRHIAAHLLQQERMGHTLQPTALVHEAYLQLLGDTEIDWKDRNHFFAAAAQSMRRILVDYARLRKAQKREGGRQRVELSDSITISDERLDEVIAIDEALTKLAQWAPRQCRVVELRFFGGFTDGEIADVLGVGRRTVSREWNIARAWLHGELNGPAAG
jgi:RNA polymerase sigma factor (TIGR02999 family)